MTTPTLLGYLARFGSFSMQSEVLSTQGLAYLLQTHEDGRSAMADEVEARTGIAIGDSLTWLPEALQEDGGRPDLEARMAKEVPIVKIEAKLGAELLPGQLQSYVEDLQKRNSGETALLVLVPKWQTASVRRVIVDTFGLSGSKPWRVPHNRLSGGVVISIITWDELFDALQAGKEERYRYELEQLKAMYHVLSGDFIAPLASVEDLEQWRSHEADLLNVVDRATRRLTTQHSLYPMGSEMLEDDSHTSEPLIYRRRYVCACADNSASCFSIGVRDSFALWVTPIWMRFHGSTGKFKRIRQRIDEPSAQWLESGGHIWIPLHVQYNASGEKMVQSIVDQAERVLQVAYQT